MPSSSKSSPAIASSTSSSSESSASTPLRFLSVSGQILKLQVGKLH
jgi:hypothetical protein